MNPWAILGGVLLLIAVAFGGYHKGHEIGSEQVQAEWDKDKLERAAASTKAILAAVASNEAKHAVDLKQTQKVIANYETALDIKNAAITAERNTAKRLRVTIDRAGICDRTATAGQTAGAKLADDEGGAATVDLPEAVERRLLDLAEDADRQIAIRDAALAGLREWIVSHGFYGPEPAK